MNVAVSFVAYGQSAEAVGRSLGDGSSRQGRNGTRVTRRSAGIRVVVGRSASARGDERNAPHGLSCDARLFQTGGRRALIERCTWPAGAIRFGSRSLWFILRTIESLPPEVLIETTVEGEG